MLRLLLVSTLALAATAGALAQAPLAAPIVPPCGPARNSFEQ